MRGSVSKNEANEWWEIGVEPDEIPVSVYWHRVKVLEVESTGGSWGKALIAVLADNGRTTRCSVSHLHPIHPLEFLADLDTRDFVIEENVPQKVASSLVALRGLVSPGKLADFPVDQIPKQQKQWAFSGIRE